MSLLFCNVIEFQICSSFLFLKRIFNDAFVFILLYSSSLPSILFNLWCSFYAHLQLLKHDL
uniref:Uncharacterized protein n=1 Tax=Cannabis sativa TaxID=3483 RepID=A0A803QZF4_CANSA